MTCKSRRPCCHCGRLISSNNIHKHETACQTVKQVLSPLEVKQKRRENLKKAREKITPEIRVQVAKKIAEAHKRGCYDKSHLEQAGKPGRPHTEETKKLLSELAKNSKHRRLMRNTTEYCGVLMDSSWEVKLAMWLDERSISWTRPGPFVYDDNRCYFPDFYLPEFNVYVDTKNDYLIQVDSEKVVKAALQNNVEIIILSRENLVQLGVM